jgi:hypothetical protein
VKAKALALALLALGAFLFVLVFALLPIERSDLAIDWKIFWDTTRGFQLNYSGQLAFTPPWAMALLWPFTTLPLSASWALWSFALLAVLLAAASVSSVRSQRAAAILLCTSYPAVRQLVDGNIELLIIAGALLIVWALPRRQPLAFAAGVLLTSAKIQESWLLLAVACSLAYVQWGLRSALKAYALAAVPVAASLLWRGADWWAALQRFPFAGTSIDASLRATFARLGLPDWLFIASWLAGLAATLLVLRRRGGALGRPEAGALVAAGLLLAPYAASNSVLTPLTLAAPALFARRLWLGAGLFVLADLPYLLLGDVAWRFNAESNYWTGFLVLLLWGISLWEIRSSKRSNQ